LHIQEQIGHPDEDDRHAWVSPHGLITAKQRILATNMCPAGCQRGAYKARTLVEFQTHMRNTHALGTPCGPPPVELHNRIKEFMYYHGGYYCDKHNKTFSTHSTSMRSDGNFCLRYNACKLCADGDYPDYVCPSPRYFLAAYPVFLSDLKAPLSQEEHAKSTLLRNGGMPIKDHTAVNLNDEDRASLLPCKWISDQVVAAFATLLNRRCLYEKKKVHMVSPDLYSSLYKPKSGYMYSTVQRYLAKISIRITKLDILLVPVFCGNHFVLVVMYKAAKRIVLYDSLASSDRDRYTIAKHIRAWIVDEFTRLHTPGTPIPSEEDWTITENSSLAPQQPDNFSCGIYVCATAGAIAEEGGPVKFDPALADSLRSRVALAVLASGDPIKDARDDLPPGVYPAKHPAPSLAHDPSVVEPDAPTMPSKDEETPVVEPSPPTMPSEDDELPAVESTTPAMPSKDDGKIPAPRGVSLLKNQLQDQAVAVQEDQVKEDQKRYGKLPLLLRESLAG